MPKRASKVLRRRSKETRLSKRKSAKKSATKRSGKKKSKARSARRAVVTRSYTRGGAYRSAPSSQFVLEKAESQQNQLPHNYVSWTERNHTI